MSRRKDPYVNEFGVADDPFGGEPQRGFDPGVDSNPTRRQAFDDLTRLAHLGVLKPLNGRKVIERDWMTDWEGSEEWFGKRKGPSLAEINELHQEWGREIDNEIDRQLAKSRQPQPQPPPQQQRSAEETAELLWNEFKQAYPDHARDANAVEREARKLIEAGGLQLDNRASFYDRLAAELER